MARTGRLGTVFEIARRQEDEASRLLAECRARMQAHEQRAEQLRGFQAEYAERLHRSASAGMAVQQMREQSAFLTRLGEALDQEQQRLQRLRPEFEQRSRAWREARARSLALEKALDREAREARALAERRDQSASDERARHRPRASTLEDDGRGRH